MHITLYPHAVLDCLFFELVSILFAIVPDYGNIIIRVQQKKIKIEPVLKILHHN